jgi:hypothetical protein
MVGRVLRLLLGCLVIAVIVPSATAAQTAKPTDESVVVASLLQVDDVFAGSTSNGVTIGPADDLPAFAANGGIREARQTWTSSDPIALVFDFRFQFPDEASAVAFLDASETDLAEVSNGLVSTPLLDPPLPDTRFYAADLGSFGVNFNYLMHLGNLAAKVFVGGSGDVTKTQASEIAHAAAARMMAALPGASPSTAPSEAPGTSPSASPVPTPDPAAIAALLVQVPPALVPSCAPKPFTPEAAPRDGELARISCAATNGTEVTYAAFESAEAVNTAFSAGELVAQLIGQLSTSGTCEGGGYDGTWTRDGTQAGQLLCYSLEDAAVIDWSDPSHRMLGSIQRADGDSAAAFQAWQEAGTGSRASGT